MQISKIYDNIFYPYMFISSFIWRMIYLFFYRVGIWSYSTPPKTILTLSDEYVDKQKKNI